MFGEDRFGIDEDFARHYAELGGSLEPEELNRIIRLSYEYLDKRYPDPQYRECFPTLQSALLQVIDQSLDQDEINRIIDTFAFHELGEIPAEYADALKLLQQRYRLAAVIDIWSPKALWLQAFEQSAILELFSAMSFSSDHGWVKPSPRPYERVLQQLGVSAAEALVVGDSVRRDLGGASNAGIDCILVGGACHADALMCLDSLLELAV